MRSESSSVVIRLPDIHLTAAGTVLTGTRVRRSGVPAEDVGLKKALGFLGPQRELLITYLAVNEFDVLGALRIAIACTELGAGLIIREFRHATVRVHLTKVESAVDTAREVGHIDVEAELLVLELENLVGSLIRQ